MNTNAFFRKLQHLLLMAAGAYPLAVLATCHAAPEAVGILPVFSLLFLSFGTAGLLLPGRFRSFAAVLGAASMVAAAVLLLPVGQAKLLILLPLGYAVLLFAALPLAGKPLEAELHPAWPVGGLLAHMLLQILVDNARRQESARYAQAVRPLMITFLLFAALALLALNRASLRQASQSRVTVPVRMRRQNILLTMALLTASVLVASLPAIAAFLRELWDGMIRGIAAAAGWLSSLLSTGSGGGGGGGGNMAPVFEAQEVTEPGLVQVIIEKVMYVLAMIAAAALVIWMGRRLWQKLRQGLRWLWSHLAQFGSAASKDYEDEITDTRDDGEYENSGLLKQLRRRFPGSDRGDLTPARQVRRRYLRLRMKHEEWSSASTARETLPAEAARLYERVRYGHEELTAEEAGRFREDTRRL